MPSKILAEWAAECGIWESVIPDRVRGGMDLEWAVPLPLDMPTAGESVSPAPENEPEAIGDPQATRN